MGDRFHYGDRVFCLGGPQSGAEDTLDAPWGYDPTPILPRDMLMIGCNGSRYRFGWRLPSKVVALYVPPSIGVRDPSDQLPP